MTYRSEMRRHVLWTLTGLLVVFMVEGWFRTHTDHLFWMTVVFRLFELPFQVYLAVLYMTWASERP